jgi:colicin import membrane protein
MGVISMAMYPRILITFISVFLLSAPTLAQTEADVGTSLQAEQIARFKADIKYKIMRYIVLPPSLVGNPEVEFDLVLLPAGQILNVKLRRSSGNEKYDSAVERAIRKADPLPVPPDEKLFREAFLEFNLKFRPQE